MPGTRTFKPCGRQATMCSFCKQLLQPCPIFKGSWYATTLRHVLGMAHEHDGTDTEPRLSTTMATAACRTRKKMMTYAWPYWLPLELRELDQPASNFYFEIALLLATNACGFQNLFSLLFALFCLALKSYISSLAILFLVASIATAICRTAACSITRPMSKI